MIRAPSVLTFDWDNPPRVAERENQEKFQTDRDHPPGFAERENQEKFQTDRDHPPRATERENQEKLETAEMSLQWIQRWG
jgi:hypothetical protein